MPSARPTGLFILLPVRDQIVTAGDPEPARFLRSLSIPGVVRTGAGDSAGLRMTVLDSIREDGAKLVEIPLEAVPALRRLQPGMRFVPLSYFHTAVAPRMGVLEAPPKARAAVAPKIRMKIVSAGDGLPVPQATVVAFTDFQARVGAQGTTNQRGEVDLALNSTRPVLERLYVYPKLGFWGALKKSIRIAGGTEIELTPIDLGYQDALRNFYASSAAGDGAGLKVGVVDTGIGPHPDLTVEGGRNTVEGEDPNDYLDNGAQHGTHVGGIIAAHGAPPLGLRGVAPGTSLRSYRVFGKNSDSASNYAIAKAIDAAVADGCDLINLSLGGGEADEATGGAIQQARAQGTLIFAAAGNDDRSPVSFPASDSLALAVSAMGRKGTFPSGSIESDEVAAPYGTDKKNFMASFTNIGSEVDLTGPGVGILSTVPGGYATMSGTSMSCPAVTGAAARLLARKPEILALSRDMARSTAMAQYILQSAQSLGFGALFEGQGLLP